MKNDSAKSALRLEPVLKNYIAPEGATLTLSAGGRTDSVDLYTPEGLDLLSNLWIKAAAQQRLMYECTWLGRPIIQFATDVVAIQELIWTVKPDLIIETGVAHGGSLVLSASMLELLGNGKVVGIDIEIRPQNREAIEAHPMSKRISLIEGSSVEAATIDKVRALAKGAKRVMVFLDSNHTEEHVRQELELYSPFVTPESYIVAHDGAQAWVWEIPRGKPEWKDNHPITAIQNFVAKNPAFIIDPHWTRFGITSSPYGYLKRVKA
jgi:cephalosporin hydroxylase